MLIEFFPFSGLARFPATLFVLAKRVIVFKFGFLFFAFGPDAGAGLLRHAFFDRLSPLCQDRCRLPGGGIHEVQRRIS